MAETKHLTPGLLWRLLGFKGGSINISEKGITLNKDNKSHFKPSIKSIYAEYTKKNF